ncbi:MAG: hypothetical protein IJ551_11365 [Prevotella sp.]|nr:hypothetical protein [Prevotella sp.]
MGRWLLLLLMALTPVLANWQGGAVTQEHVLRHDAAGTVIAPQDNRHHEATLTDATSLYRVCSNRPQRILPTHGSSSQRDTTPCLLARRQFVKPLQCLHDSRRRLETAPFCRPASCQYYVYALRHIIR